MECEVKVLLMQVICRVKYLLWSLCINNNVCCIFAMKRLDKTGEICYSIYNILSLFLFAYSKRVQVLCAYSKRTPSVMFLQITVSFCE